MRKLLWCLVILTFVLLFQVGYSVPVTDGLIIHLRADDLLLNDGDHVTSWPDTATFNNTINGTVGTYTGIDTPLFKTNVRNGYPVVRFDGADVLCTTPSLTAPTNLFKLPVPGNGVTIFAHFTGGGSGLKTERMAQIGKTDGNGGQVVGLDVSSSTDTSDTDAGSGFRFNNGKMLVRAGNPLTTGFHTGAWRAANGEQHQNQKYFVNGVLQTYNNTGSPTNTLGFPTTKNTIFVVGDGNTNTTGWISGDYYTGDLAEILIYNAQLSDAQVQQVTRFLDYKYKKATAHNPAPAHKAIGQGTLNGSNVEVTFTWTTGRDPNNISIVNPRITQHYFYLSADEPNFLQTVPVPVPLGSSYTATVNMDKTYYWRVDESVNGSSAGSSITITGPVWSFDAIKSAPIITTQPVSTMAFVGDTATFTIAATSIAPLHYYWYKSADATASPDTDALLSVPDSATLSIPVTVASEGYYFCKVDNGSAVLSDVVMLGVKRQVAHWTLDSINYVGGVYQDVCTQDPNDFPIDPNLPPVTGSIVPNSQFPALGDCLNLTVEPMAAGWTKKVWAAAYTDNITVTAWVKWQGAEGITANQGIVANQADAVDGGNQNNWFLDIPASDDKARFNVAGTGGGSATGPVLATNEWVHVTGSVGPAGIKLYVNGKTEAVNNSVKALVNRHRVPFYVGCSQRAVTGIQEILNGSIDDARVYNYQLSDAEIAQMYYEISQVPVCINPSSLSMAFDVAGGGLAGDEPDCLVNLKDFAAFAAAWMNCGYYPQTDCP